MVEVNRRGLILGLGALFAAPAIVRAESLMKVRPIVAYSVIQPGDEITVIYDGVLRIWRVLAAKRTDAETWFRETGYKTRTISGWSREDGPLVVER